MQQFDFNASSSNYNTQTILPTTTLAMQTKWLSFAVLLVLLVAMVMARSLSDPYVDEREYDRREFLRRVLNALYEQEDFEERAGSPFFPSSGRLSGSRTQECKFRYIISVRIFIQVLFRPAPCTNHLKY